MRKLCKLQLCILVHLYSEGGFNSETRLSCLFYNDNHKLCVVLYRVEPRYDELHLGSVVQKVLAI